MIELIGAAIAVADLLDAEHATGDGRLFDPVTRSFRPVVELKDMGTTLRCSVIPRRATSEAVSRGHVDHRPTVFVVMQQKLVSERGPENDFEAAAEFVQKVADVENTLWASKELDCEDPAVELELVSIEESPEGDEAVSALALDERRVLTAVLACNYLSRRTIGA